MPNLPSESPDLLLLNGAIVQHEDLVGELIAKLASSNLKRQVIDRLLEGKVKLEPGIYASIYIAPANAGIPQKLTKPLLEVLFDALVPGGCLRGDFAVASSLDSIMTGFVETEDKTLLKPNNSAPQTISLQNNRKLAVTSGTKKKLPIFKKLNSNKRDADDISSIVQLNLNDDNDDDDDLIDENDLISQSLSSSIILPSKCDPGPGKKRRKACKDCTCGLRELELQEEEKRKQKEQNVVSLNLDDEIDFTVPGKTGGSCGSCALGDAFRCDGCPYLGLPPFKPGEIINIAAIKNDF